MLRKNKPAKDSSPRMTKEEFERRLRETLDNNPGASIDEVVRRVKGGETSPAPPPGTTGPAASDQKGGSGDPGTGNPGQNFIGWVRKNPIVALFITVLLVGFIAVAVIFGPGLLRPDPTTTPVATGTTDIVDAPDAIQFQPGTAITIAPGETKSLPLSVLAGGQAAAGVTLSFAVSPPEGGAITPTAITDTGGAISVDFTAGNTQQPVTIIAQVDANPGVRAEYMLTIAHQPVLSVSFKDDPPAALPIRVGENFIVWFRVDNTGQADADNPTLTVNTPPGLIVVEAEGCTINGTGTVSCELGGIPAGQKATKFITYRADGPATASFTPDVYSVSYNGASAPIRGSEAWTANVESPLAAGVSLTPVSSELGANGTLTTTLYVEVKDQWDAAFTGPATVELTIEREGAGGVITPLPTELPLPVSCNTTHQTTLTPLGDGQAAQPVDLPAATNMSATAYDLTNARLFVTATLIDGTEEQGWVQWQADTILCQGDVTTLPAEPPQVTAAASPDGLILGDQTQTFPEDSGAFIYQAGTQSGTLRIVAHLLDGDRSESDPATITLLETGSLGRTSHVFNSPQDLSGESVSTMIFFSMPTGTSLELYPLNDNAPDARQVALRVWIPSENVTTDESGQTKLTGPAGKSASAGTEPPAAASAAGDETQWQEGAADRPVAVLEERGGFKLVRIIGWVPANVLAAEE